VARSAQPASCGNLQSERLARVGKAQKVQLNAVDWASFRIFHFWRGVIVGTLVRDNRAKLHEGMVRHNRLRPELGEL